MFHELIIEDMFINIISFLYFERSESTIDFSAPIWK